MRDPDHLKKPWEIDANAEKNNGNKEHEEAFCLLGLVAAVLYFTSRCFVWWDFGGMTMVIYHKVSKLVGRGGYYPGIGMG